jgi:hypothetical protein
MLRGIELQFRTRSRIIKTEKGEALAIRFSLGPLALFIIANLPETDDDDTEQPLVFVKITLNPIEDWPVFKNHEAPKRAFEGIRDGDYDER